MYKMRIGALKEKKAGTVFQLPWVGKLDLGFRKSVKFCFVENGYGLQTSLQRSYVTELGISLMRYSFQPSKSRPWLVFVKESIQIFWKRHRPLVLEICSGLRRIQKQHEKDNKQKKRYNCVEKDIINHNNYDCMLLYTRKNTLNKA
jgi:hypothetical protein